MEYHLFRINDMITRERISVSRAQDPAGGMCPYLNVGGYDWRTNTPDRPDSLVEKRWPIWAEYQSGPTIVWYWGGSYRSSNGSKWGTPTRWFYGRREEEVWNPSKQQWEINGLYYTAPPTTPPVGKVGVHIDAVAGQQLIDILKRSFTWEQIMTFGDLSPYDEPDTGAPEPGAGV
jgi:hypothetical protein